MNILLLSYSFFPSIGGIETVSRLLVEEFQQLGHNVVVLTMTKQEDLNSPPIIKYSILRNPDFLSLVRISQWADVVVQNNMSISLSWVSYLFRKPQVIAHHTWINRASGRVSLVDRLKLLSLKFALNISNSYATADSLPVRSFVIENPYDANNFFMPEQEGEKKDLVFVGRLVSDKGVDLLIRALKILKTQGYLPSLTIVGCGVEEKNLKELSHQLDVSSQIEFVGNKIGYDLCKLLNSHRIMVVPSRWNEPYGVVALEGIACGCVIVGSSGGGLKDAIGACGLTFPNGDYSALAECLKVLLVSPYKLYYYQSFAYEHLRRHHPSFVAKAYLKVINDAVLLY